MWRPLRCDLGARTVGSPVSLRWLPLASIPHACHYTVGVIAETVGSMWVRGSQCGQCKSVNFMARGVPLFLVASKLRLIGMPALQQSEATAGAKVVII